MLSKNSYISWLMAFSLVLLMHVGAVVILLRPPAPPLPLDIQQAGRAFSLTLAPVVQSRPEVANDNLSQSSAQQATSQQPEEVKLIENTQQPEQVKAPIPNSAYVDKIEPKLILKPEVEKDKPRASQVSPKTHKQAPPSDSVQEVSSEVSLAQASTIKNVNHAEQTSSSIEGSEMVHSKQAKHDWRQKMIAHLMRYKRYPRMARLKKQQGTVLVYFVMDRRGNVLRSSLINPDDQKVDPSLQREAKNVVKRAQPLPVPPKEGFDDLIEMVVPIVFSLNGTQGIASSNK